MNAEQLREQLKGYSPALAAAQEAAGSHDSNKKFAPPWYEVKHFRATLHITGIYPNRNGIDGVVFDISEGEVFEGAGTQFHVPLPKTPPGYPTDELNLMVQAASELDPKIQNVADLDGLEAEMELDYADHPWMKERGKEGNDIVVNGTAIPKRCWYYKAIAIYGAKADAPAPEPKPESVSKLVEFMVGNEVKMGAEENAWLLRSGLVGLKIQDPALQSLVSAGKFPTWASERGLLVIDDGKYAAV